jgi:hypothetical protein
MKKIAMIALGGLLLVAVPVLAASANASTTVSVTVAAAAQISVNATTTLIYVGTFPTGSYDGTSTVTFSCRTTRVGGSGSITLSATAPTWTSGGGLGPLVADLNYSSARGTYVGAGAVVGTTTVQNGVETNVVTGLGANNRTSAQTVFANFTLADNVNWETDTYTLPVRFTLNAI